MTENNNVAELNF